MTVLEIVTYVPYCLFIILGYPLASQSFDNSGATDQAEYSQNIGMAITLEVRKMPILGPIQPNLAPL
jgi:hypothetical protein